MDTLQTQISEMQDKIDKLHQLIEQLAFQVKELSSQPPKRMEHDSYSLPSFASGAASFINQDGDADYQLTHKDILVDDNSSSSSANSSSEKLSPDTQIRRPCTVSRLQLPPSWDSFGQIVSTQGNIIKRCACRTRSRSGTARRGQ